MCTRSTKSDYPKKKSKNERQSLPCKKMNSMLRKNYKEHFLFSYICSLFLVANDKFILHHDIVQKRKLQNLLKISSNSDNHNPERVVFNFSSDELTDDEKNVL